MFIAIRPNQQIHTLYRLLGKNSPTNDRNNTFENVMNILGNLGPEYSDLIFIVTQPLLDTFYVKINVKSLFHVYIHLLCLFRMIYTNPISTT